MTLIRFTLPALAVLVATLAFARDVSQIDPPYPRIGNCYGAGLAWQPWEKGAEYWSKLDLFIGGCYDLHYDWENARWPRALQTLEANIAHLREVNPTALVLPYVDVIEGPDNPNIPQKWWDLNDKGERWSGWPGMYRINMKLPEVLQYNLDKVRDEVFGREIFDGVFYDCWSPDPWLCPRTAKLRDGKAIVMLNAWNLPREGFESLNGVLAEDEINRVIEGKVDFEDFLARYLRWCRDSRKPCTTMIVCRPREINDDPWRWAKMKREEIVALQQHAKDSDQQTMRFGLATTLMGDGYFGYDCGTSGRGNWWWYKEYDAPLGHPKGAARRNTDGTWQREFDGGTVVVNGSQYDAVVRLPRKCADLSTGRVGEQFTIPMFDGRIFLPSDAPATITPDMAPRLTLTPPKSLRAVELGGLAAVQTPGGLELRLEPNGAIRSILWHGKTLMTGGNPVVAAPGWRNFSRENVTGGADAGGTGVDAGGTGVPPVVTATYRGDLTQEQQRASFVETVTVSPGDSFTLHFAYAATTDLDLRMWRHYFAFPVATYAGATASAGGKSATLPATLGDDQLLPAAKHVELAGKAALVTIDSTLPLGLIDHRKYGMAEYLLAGYPVGGAVKAGTKWEVEMTVAVKEP